MDELQKYIGLKVFKKCPEGHNYVMRLNRQTGEVFLGCSQYPLCKHTEIITSKLADEILGHHAKVKNIK